MRFSNCEFCQKCDFQNVNFVKNVIFKMWILTKMRLWKCEFCQKWDFEIVNFVKSVTLKLWIFWKMSLWNCEFCQKCDFQNVNLWINYGFLPQCATSKNSLQFLTSMASISGTPKHFTEEFGGQWNCSPTHQFGKEIVTFWAKQFRHCGIRG